MPEILNSPKSNFMNKLELYPPQPLRNAEHYQFMTEFKTAIDVVTPEVLGIKDEYPPFATALQKENAALKIEQGSAQTEEAEHWEVSRDAIWDCSMLRIESALISPLAAEIESAKVIKRVFDVYGDIRRHPVNQESGEMSNLVEDLLKPENAQHLVNIHLDKVIPEMKKANDQYIQVVSSRNEDISRRASRDVRAVRREVDPLYLAIAEAINATITLKLAKPETAKFVEEHKQRVKVYEAKIAARKTINKKPDTK